MIATEHDGDFWAHLNNTRIVAVARHFSIAHLQQLTIKKNLLKQLQFHIGIGRKYDASVVANCKD